MRILDRLERRVGRYVPENITMIILAGQVIGYVLVYANPRFYQYFILSGERLLAGEIWRLATFIFGPVSESLIFVIFAWYFFYFLGTALEKQWGSFRYLSYLAISYFASVIFALVFPYYPFTNFYLFTTLFLAFAHLYPNFQLLLFFIIPIRVRWLGYVAWLGLIASFIFGGLELKILILLSVLNFFLFFSRDLIYTVKVIVRGLSGSPQKAALIGKPLHICAVCGKNEKSNPDMDIRYCSTCFPDTCYCGEHIRSHAHKKAIN